MKHVILTGEGGKDLAPHQTTRFFTSATLRFSPSCPPRAGTVHLPALADRPGWWQPGACTLARVAEPRRAGTHRWPAGQAMTCFLPNE